MGLERGESIVRKKELVLTHGKKKKKKKGNIEAAKKRVYVLPSMFVTFPTCQAESSPLKSPAV